MFNEIKNRIAMKKYLLTLLIAPLYAQTGVKTADTNILVEKNVMVSMRDGVRLATDIYRLRDTTPAPVLIARTPYDKNFLWQDVGSPDSRTDDTKRYVNAGYVVVQDVRGRYASEGDFNPHANETGVINIVPLQLNKKREPDRFIDHPRYAPL
jgi:predicted acyl esterase